MIGQLQGKLVKKQPPLLILDVQGVGYEVEAPMTTFYKLPETGANILLYTHLVVRDDAHLLFGFATDDERRLFRTLIKVNGVGAKMALTILSGMESSVFTACIRDGDSASLTRLPGVGKKTAERLIVEMRDRLKDLDQVGTKTDDTDTQGSQVASDSIGEAISALIALGYKPQEASRYVHTVSKDGMKSEEIIRNALKVSINR